MRRLARTSLEQRDTVKERTLPKLPKLEHVALNSASETGAEIHQNTQICKLNFKFSGGYAPRPPYRGGATCALCRCQFVTHR